MGQPTCFVQISFIKFATVSHTRRATGGRPRLAQAGDRGGQHQTRFCPVCANFQVGENLPPPWSPSDWLACRHWTNGRGEKCESKTPEPDGCIRHPTTFSVRYKTLARSELGEIRGGSESQSPAWLGPHIRLAGPLSDKNCCRLQTVLHTSQDQSNELLHGKKGHKTAGIEPSWDCFTPGLCSCLLCSGQPSPAPTLQFLWSVIAGHEDSLPRARCGFNLSGLCQVTPQTDGCCWREAFWTEKCKPQWFVQHVSCELWAVVARS